MQILPFHGKGYQDCAKRWAFTKRYDRAMQRGVLSGISIFAVLCGGVVAQTASEKYQAVQQAWKAAYSKPWHRVSSYELTASDGKKLTGAVEETYFSDTERSLVVTGSVTYQEIRNASGTFERGAAPPFLLRLALDSLTRLPDVSSDKDLSLTTGDSLKGAVELQCASLARKDIKPNAKLGSPEIQYCFDHQDAVLRAVHQSVIFTVYNRTGKFRDAYVPLRVETAISNQPVVSVNVQKLEQGIGDKSLLDIPSGAQKIEDEAVVAPVEVKSSKKIPPEYPMMARSSHISGTVVLAVTIDRDGVVKAVEPVASPNRLLTDASTEVVKRWQYKGDGLSSRVRTLVIINYSIGD
ncbi:MAG: energy transducer TonB [Acidobacteriaceae bacterium]|nr:energy transducer TonB [Acidobacteriaceae bacterium]